MVNLEFTPLKLRFTAGIERVGVDIKLGCRLDNIKRI